MESLNNKNGKNLEKFISKLISHPKYGNMIADSYAIGIPDCLTDPFVFGFKEGTKLPPEAEEFCNENFYEYFPNGELLNKLY